MAKCTVIQHYGQLPTYRFLESFHTMLDQQDHSGKKNFLFLISSLHKIKHKLLQFSLIMDN